MHDLSSCPLCQAAAIQGSMSDEEFRRYLTACRHELADKQSQFQRVLSQCQTWHYDLASCKINFNEKELHFVPIGTFSDSMNSWLWAWANPDFPEQARTLSRYLQSLHAMTGFQVFLDPGIKASRQDAEDFSALALHYLGGQGIFRAPGNPDLYLSVCKS